MATPSIPYSFPVRLAHCIILLLKIVFLPTCLPAQSTGLEHTSTNAAGLESDNKEKERPDQFDVFKINAGQFAINEARISYEIQVGPASSLEFGAGYIYPNSFWFERSTETVLARGFGLYASFRKYHILNRFLSTPVFRPYLSPTVFYRSSSYQNEWFLIPGASSDLSECSRYDQSFHQIGTSIRFGWQTTQGRLVIDLYTGLGLKFVSSRLIQTAVNRESYVCEEIDITDYTIIHEDIFDTQVIIQGGMKVGVRLNNRDRNNKFKDNGTIPEENTSPPIYRQ